MSKTVHLCIHVDTALERLKKGQNFLDCTPSEALTALVDQRNAGKEYFTGCDREDETGRCMGHPHCLNCGEQIPTQKLKQSRIPVKYCTSQCGWQYNYKRKKHG